MKVDDLTAGTVLDELELVSVRGGVTEERVGRMREFSEKKNWVAQKDVLFDRYEAHSARDRVDYLLAIRSLREGPPWALDPEPWRPEEEPLRGPQIVSNPAPSPSFVEVEAAVTPSFLDIEVPEKRQS